MSSVESFIYRGYTISRGLVGGRYDANGHLVERSKAYSFVSAKGRISKHSYNTVGHVKHAVDQDIELNALR